LRRFSLASLLIAMTGPLVRGVPLEKLAAVATQC